MCVVAKVMMYTVGKGSVVLFLCRRMERGGSLGFWRRVKADFVGGVEVVVVGFKRGECCWGLAKCTRRWGDGFRLSKR
jgi:hypothetical protein